jgi:hypothetical protein
LKLQNKHCLSTNALQNYLLLKKTFFSFFLLTQKERKEEMTDVLPVLSNFFFLIPAAEAVYMRRWTRFMIYLLILISSSMYHTCAGFANACAFDSMTHRHMDFFFAQLIIPLTALYIIVFPPKWAFLERILIISFAFVIFITQVVWGESNFIQMILAAVSLVMILVYWIVYAVTEFAKNPGAGWHLPSYDWPMFVMGLGCTAVACNLYATQLQYHGTYWATHSCWHTLAAFGQYFILLILPRMEGAEYMSLDNEILSVDMRRRINIGWHTLIRHTVPKSRV